MSKKIESKDIPLLMIMSFVLCYSITLAQIASVTTLFGLLVVAGGMCFVIAIPSMLLFRMRNILRKLDDSKKIDALNILKSKVIITMPIFWIVSLIIFLMLDQPDHKVISFTINVWFCVITFEVIKRDSFYNVIPPVINRKIRIDDTTDRNSVNSLSSNDELDIGAKINPANGAPIMRSGLDIYGNTYGTDYRKDQ